MAPSTVELVPIVLVLVLAGSALWVYQDASARSRRGTGVYFSTGSLEVDTPTAWAVGCLCLWVIFMPLYLTCRNRAG